MPTSIEVSGWRIIDVSYAAAKQLGFHSQGPPHEWIETNEPDEEV